MSVAAICLAANIYHESRGEPLVGQLAVAMVTINRAREQGHRDYCKIVLAPGQFAWVTTGVDSKSNLTEWGTPREQAAWLRSQQLAKQAMSMVDFTQGATYFHERRLSPQWKKKLEVVAVWGNHVFYRKFS